MYLPKRFQTEDVQDAVKVIEQYPFATLISLSADSPFISQVPLVLDSQANELVLIGHVAYANPHWRHMEQNPKVYVLFHGPHAYINSSWYPENDVPTWNYVSVQITGECQTFHDYESILEALEKLSEHMNKGDETKWDFYLPKDLQNPNVVVRSMVGFRIKVSDLKAKFKLSQHRSQAEVEAVVHALENKPMDLHRELAAWMREFKTRSPKK